MAEKPINTNKLLNEAKSVIAETNLAYESESGLADTSQIFMPFVEVDYTAENQDVSEGENRISFEKTRIDEPMIDKLKLYIDQLKAGHGIAGRYGDYRDVNNWCAVDKLSYVVGETAFDIFGELPKGYKILFCPRGEYPREATIFTREKLICIPGDIASIGNLAVILHEVGHVQDNERLAKIGKTSFTEGGEDFTENMHAEQLRKEREASLFALRKMWPVLRNDSQLKATVLAFFSKTKHTFLIVKTLWKAWPIINRSGHVINVFNNTTRLMAMISAKYQKDYKNL